jgi:pimeloyl-ACP methyl ester carboxylesterase
MLETKVGALRIAYERAGTGPSLVLVHGYVGDATGTWQRQIDGLSDEFTVVAWDGPGAGRSSDPPESFEMADYANCLAGFIEALGLERPHVCGLSFGGGLAIALYREHPSVPRSLILADAYAGWAGSLPDEDVRLRLTQALSLADMPAERLVNEVVPTMFSRSAPAEMIEAFATNISAFHPSGFRTMARAFAEADLRDVLPTIEIPTLLLYGDEDVRAPLAVAEQLHSAIGGSKLVVLPGVGHISSIEGADRFNEEVRSFIRLHT